MITSTRPNGTPTTTGQRPTDEMIMTNETNTPRIPQFTTPYTADVSGLMYDPESRVSREQIEIEIRHALNCALIVDRTIDPESENDEPWTVVGIGRFESCDHAAAYVAAHVKNAFAWMRLRVLMTHAPGARVCTPGIPPNDKWTYAQINAIAFDRVMERLSAMTGYYVYDGPRALNSSVEISDMWRGVTHQPSSVGGTPIKIPTRQNPHIRYNDGAPILPVEMVTDLDWGNITRRYM